jgi:hypothetical protein
MRLTVVAICLAAAPSPALAKTAHPAHHNRVATVRATRPVQPAPLRRPETVTTPAPAPTAEFNPLKRRHMAMPGSPPTDFAF